MPKPKRLDAEGVRDMLAGSKGNPGLFERALGFRTSTTAIKGVHLMNDLAQCTLGGTPQHRGDLLCRVIREDKADEPNGDRDLRDDERFGDAYGRAYPVALGAQRVSRLREAARLLLNADGGMYRAGDAMASGLATHRDLLGAEGFRRFGVGRYLHRALGVDGRQRVRELFTSETDPVTQALRPLLLRQPLEEKGPSLFEAPSTPLDEALGRRLTALTRQPLSKPTLLRYVCLAGSLAVTLKIYGLGRQAGRPTLLALPVHRWVGRSRPGREEAVQSLKQAVDALDRRLAELMPSHPNAQPLWDERPKRGADILEVPSAPSLSEGALGIIQASREQWSSGSKALYWPDRFAVALGKKAGCVGPLNDHAGWSKYMTLTPELVELLTLMYVPAGSPALPWRELWRQVADELGLLIGANSHEDDLALKAAGVLHVDLGQLAESSDEVLRQAVARGVARRLPDAGAEAGGELP